MSGRVFTGLGPAQADGQACVICGRDFGVRGSGSVPVGHSHTGSQVFACDGRCEAAAARGRVSPPIHVVYDDMAALLADIPLEEDPDTAPLFMPVEAIDALCDASMGVYRAELEAAVRETVAPLLVAAELRRLAGEIDPATGHPSDPAEEPGVNHARQVWAGYLRARAAELDGGGPR